MLSQNDFFTKAVLGPVKKPELGVPLPIDKSSVAYTHGIAKLKRRDWLKDKIRSEIAGHLDIPAEFVVLQDPVALRTRSAMSAWTIGFWLAGLFLLGIASIIWLTQP